MKKQEEIRKQAKEIMKKFAASLEKVKFKKKEKKQKIGGFREERGEKLPIKISEKDFSKMP